MTAIDSNPTDSSAGIFQTPYGCSRLLRHILCFGCLRNFLLVLCITQAGTRLFDFVAAMSLAFFAGCFTLAIFSRSVTSSLS
jgi:hypothetical protein